MRRLLEICLAGLALAGGFLAPSTALAARTESQWAERLGTYLETAWPEGRDILINGENKYLNFGDISGATGYGFRDLAGVLQWKDDGGSWAPFGSGGSGWSTSSADYWILASTTIPKVGGATYGDLIGWTGSSWGKFATSSLGIVGYSDEQAQDAVGAMASTTLTYDDATPLFSINFDHANTWTQRQSFDERTGPEIVLNGGFTGAATSWSLGSGWAYSSNAVSHTSNGTATLSQSGVAVAGTAYTLTFTLSNVTVGSVTPSVGGVTLTQRSANGTYTETFTAASTAALAFTPSNTSRLTVDDVSLKAVSGGGVLALNSRPATAIYTAPVSAPVAWKSAAWKSNATAASQPVDFQAVLKGVTGSSVVKGLWALQGSVNSGALADLLTVSSTGETAINVRSGVSATTGLEISGPFGNSTPGTTRLLRLNSTSGYANVEFTHSGTLRQAIVTSSSGGFNMFASGDSYFAFYNGNSGLTSNTLFAYLYPTAFVQASGGGWFAGEVVAGIAQDPSSTLTTAGSFAAKVSKKTANFTADANATTYICDAGAASCTGTPSATCASHGDSTACALYDAHGGCSWYAGASCSAFANEGGMGTCSGTTGCSVDTTSCAGPTDQSACETQDDAYGGSCSWGNTGDCSALGSGTCGATSGCTETPDDCANYSDGGGDGTACNNANGGSYCSYDSGSGACSGGTFGFLSCSGTYDACSGSYNTGGCSGTYGAECQGTATCPGIDDSTNCGNETGCAWTTAITATLPAITAAPDRIYTFYNADSAGADVILTPNAADTVNHTTSYTLAAYKDFVTVTPYRDTASCSEFVTSGACTPTGCSVQNANCSYDTGTNECSGHADCPAHNGNQSACEAQTYFQQCNGTYVISSNWYVVGR